MIVTKIILFKEKISLLKININKLEKIIIALMYLANFLFLKIKMIIAKELIMFHKISNKKMIFRIMIKKKKSYLMNRKYKEGLNEY